MATPSHRLLARLQRDISDLLGDSYPGISVFLHESDIRKFCLVLTPPAGPWKGLSLHFNVKIPDAWPTIPPIISSTIQGIDHPNLEANRVCCDLLRNTMSLPRGEFTGYTPAFTLKGLFVQFLTFFSSPCIEQESGAHVAIGDTTLYRYIEERSISPETDVWAINVGCDCLFGSNSASDETNEKQRDLERRWKEDPRPEITIPNDDASPTTHKVKELTPSPSRLHLFTKCNPRWQATLDLISRWSCKRCPYGSAALPHKTTLGDVLETESGEKSALGASPPENALRVLDEDVMLEIASRMPSETITTFGQAFPPFRNLISERQIARFFLLDELRCFFLKTPIHDTILGIGVTVFPERRDMESEFEWLSLEAFEEHNVRQSIRKTNFNFFLPLAFGRDHFKCARDEIWRCVTLLDTGIRQFELDRVPDAWGVLRYSPGSSGQVVRPRDEPQVAFDAIFKFMNNIVLLLVKACDFAPLPQYTERRKTYRYIRASEKAAISYWQLMHLLISVCHSDSIVLRDARRKVKAFLANAKDRTKGVVPNLGEFMVVITLVLTLEQYEDSTTKTVNFSELTWSALLKPFLEEAFTRNARWAVSGQPELMEMEDGASAHRLATTLSKTKTSLRLIMFHVAFLDVFTKTYEDIGLEALDDNYGFPPSKVPGKMVEAIKEIYEVDTWQGFFDRVHYEESQTDESLSEWLRQAVRTSKERGYHH